jgi:hypothetical protein
LYPKAALFRSELSRASASLAPAPQSTVVGYYRPRFPKSYGTPIRTFSAKNSTKTQVCHEKVSNLKHRSSFSGGVKEFVQAERKHRANFAFGLSVFDIYKDLYQKTFRFASRKPRKVGLIKESDPFFEVVFGAFPLAKKLAYFSNDFEEVCEPTIFAATAENCIKLLNGRHFLPLNATMHELDVTFENRDDPTVFVFDPHKTVDLIDFWNLHRTHCDFEVAR